MGHRELPGLIINFGVEILQAFGSEIFKMQDSFLENTFKQAVYLLKNANYRHQMSFVNEVGGAL